MTTNSALIDEIYLKLLKIQYLLDNNLSKIAKRFNFNNSELMIYLDIKTHPNTDLNALCARLGLKKSNASKAINKLIKNNYISSGPNAEDHRKVALNFRELDNVNICKETVLNSTFSGLEHNHCDLVKIEEGLEETIKLLSSS